MDPQAHLSRLLPFAIAVLTLAPSAGAGAWLPLVSEGQLCLPETVRQQCIGVEAPRCVGRACDNACLRRMAVVTSDAATIRRSCGIPTGVGPMCLEYESAEGGDCGIPIPKPNPSTKPVEDCLSFPMTCKDRCPPALRSVCGEDSSVCMDVPGTHCCVNSEGDEVPFEVLGSVDGANYNAWILRELLWNKDGQKDIRVGWNNQVIESHRAVTWELASSNRVKWVDWPDGDPSTGLYAPEVSTIVSMVEGTLDCGLILYATMGTATNPAVVEVTGYFSGVTVTTAESRSEGVSTSTTTVDESSASREWTHEVRVDVSYESLGSYTYSHTDSETDTHSYSVGKSTSMDEGVVVTYTPSEWTFSSGAFEA